MTYRDQYNLLNSNSSRLDDSIIASKKQAAWAYFRNILVVPMRNLETNLYNQFNVSISQVRKIHGSNMVCFPGEDVTDIFVDEEMYKNNPRLVDILLQHEVLHGLSQKRGGFQYSFGHARQMNELSYTGLDEAVTQMFTEDIGNVRLTKEEDYLYFLTNIMRIFKVLFGVDLIADQYFNGDLSFEEKINELTDFKFDLFAFAMNDIYDLSKKGFYDSLSVEEYDKLNKEKNKVIVFASALIEQFQNQGVKSIIAKEVSRKFLEQYGEELGINNIKTY